MTGLPSAGALFPSTPTQGGPAAGVTTGPTRPEGGIGGLNSGGPSKSIVNLYKNELAKRVPQLSTAGLTHNVASAISSRTSGVEIGIDYAEKEE